MSDAQVAIVTGGSIGIGEAVARAYAREGVRVVVAARGATEGERVVQEIRSNGGEAIFVATDVSKSADVQNLVAETISQYGRLDYACNNAGIVGDFSSLTDISEETWDSVIDTNLKGVWLCMKYQIPVMEKAGKGAIVNVASTNGLIGSAGRADYTASKHGVIGLTRAAAKGYAAAGIRVNAVCPGYTLTPMLESIHGDTFPESLSGRIPFGRFGQPDELADAIVWIGSDKASYVTGQTLVVDGGLLA